MLGKNHSKIIPCLLAFCHIFLPLLACEWTGQPLTMWSALFMMTYGMTIFLVLHPIFPAMLLNWLSLMTTLSAFPRAVLMGGVSWISSLLVVFHILLKNKPLVVLRSWLSVFISLDLACIFWFHKDLLIIPDNSFADSERLEVQCFSSFFNKWTLF